MSMELLSRDFITEFFSDKEDQRRYLEEQLSEIPETLSVVTQMDAFQHWVYRNPGHSRQDRWKT